MNQETAAFPGSSDFEFFVMILKNPWEKLRLPAKFAEFLDGQEPRKVKLREASGGSRVWDVTVLFDGEGQMYLERGWEQFARVHDMQLGHFLVFSYTGDAALTVKIFDGTMCRRHYHDDDDANTCSASVIDSGTNDISDSATNNSMDSASYNISDGARNSSTSTAAEMNIDDALTSQFTVTLKPSHLGARQKQYLNVPPAFQHAHGYDKRSEVVLRMRGDKWTVTLKHNIRGSGKTRASLRYGWHQFCVDNGLGVGDVCFFRALRLRGVGDDDHALKVEVRKQNGTFLD